MDKETILELARLACDRGAAFDVTHDADGSVRCSLYPQTLEDRMAKSVELTQSLTIEQFERLKRTLQNDIRDQGLAHG